MKDIKFHLSFNFRLAISLYSQTFHFLFFRFVILLRFTLNFLLSNHFDVLWIGNFKFQDLMSFLINNPRDSTWILLIIASKKLTASSKQIMDKQEVIFMEVIMVDLAILKNFKPISSLGHKTMNCQSVYSFFIQFLSIYFDCVLENSGVRLFSTIPGELYSRKCGVSARKVWIH